MKSIVFDIETDGLISSKIWCIIGLDVETQKTHIFRHDEIDEGVKFLEGYDKLIGHNILGFDIPVLRDLAGAKLTSKKIVDTLVLSRLFNPVREGGHGLEAWGYRLGFHKIEFEEYDKFSEEMIKYCERDVRLNYLVYNKLKEESAGFSMDSVNIEHKVADIINRQRIKGFYFDDHKATALLDQLNKRMEEVKQKVQEVLGDRETSIKIYPKLTKTGRLSKMGVTEHGNSTRLAEQEYVALKWQQETAEKCNPVIRIETEEFNLGSRKQIGDRLQELGWKPNKFTPTGQPMVDESILKNIQIHEAQLIAEYLMLQKRIAQITSWLKELQTDGRIHGFVNHNGTITSRMTHRSPNAAQIPSVSSEYGKECREIWTVPPGYKLTGADASSLELRCLAHYMNDKDFTNEILHGDIHTTNQHLAGLESRNQAKTFIYALCFGAGDKKLSTILGGDTKHARAVRQRFFDNLPSFKSLKNKVTRAAAKGYIKGLDGRKVFIRSEHAALNTLLQSAGAIIMKKALVILDKRIHNFDAHVVANVHDEWQIEVREDQAHAVGEIAVQAIRQAGIDLNLNCPLDGEYNVGSNWAETH